MITPEFDVEYYLGQVPDLRTGSEDPIAHYLERGWLQLLDPSRAFSTAYYLESHPDIRSRGVNPFLHYLEFGRFEGRVKHPDDRLNSPEYLAHERALIAPEFDSEYYFQQVPDLRGGSLDPIVHYLGQGWRELRDPSVHFSTAYYLDAHPDIRARGINPLLHYVEFGRAEGRSILSVTGDAGKLRSGQGQARDAPAKPAVAAKVPDASESLLEPKSPNPASAKNGGTAHRQGRQATTVAPEVIEALGDPTIFDVCFYKHAYSVEGSDIEVALDYLANPMRRPSPYFDPEWYLEQNPAAGPPGLAPLHHYIGVGREKGLRPSKIFNGALVDMSPDDVGRIIEGSGLFDLAWYAHTSPDVVRAAADPLKHYCRNGHLEYKRSPNVLFDNTFYVARQLDVRKYKWNPLVHYILLGSGRHSSTHPLFDVSWLRQIDPNSETGASLLARLVQGHLSISAGPNEYFDVRYYSSQHPEAGDYPGGVIGHFMEVGWKSGFDPSERFSTRGYLQANPDVRDMGTNPFQHFILTGRQEGRDPKPLPDRVPVTLERFSDPEYGAVGPVILFDADIELPASFALSIAVHLHLYYTEMTAEFCRYLSNIPVPFHLFVSVPPGRGDNETVRQAFLSGIDNCIDVTVASPENRGRDVAPFLIEFGKQLLAYDLVLHLHSKRSPHSPKHAGWRRYLLHYTLGNSAVVKQILTTFYADPKVGVFQPPYHPEIRAQPKWGDNRSTIARLLPRLGLSYLGDSCPHFPAGSFFWARTDALRPLLEGRIELDDFDDEASQTDATLAHAVERLFGLVPLLRGYAVISRFINVAHDLTDYYGKSRPFQGFERDRNLDIRAYQDAVRARHGRRGRIALVTAIIGPFDALLLPYNLEPEIDYFCVTDAVTDGYGVFRLLPPPYIDADSRRTARYVKTNLLRLFPGYDIVVWVDGNVLMRATVSEFVAATEASGCCIGAIPHPTRRSYVEEAAVAIKMKLDDPDLIATQLERYEGVDGLGKDGLIETNFMVFDARKPQTREFMQLWWNEINTYSRRDQLSINFSLLQTATSWHPLLPEYCSVRDAGCFSLFRHGLNEWGPKPHIYAGWHRPNADDGHLLPLPELHRWAKHIGRLDLDVVICVHNALEDVRACLSSVEAALNGRGQVIIVDDASGDETAKFLASYAAARMAHLVRFDERAGYTLAANAGIRAGTNRNVILLNSDTVVPAAAFEKLSDALDRDALLGILGPLSNAASHQSVPSTTGAGSQTAINQLPAGMSAAAVDLFLERRWDGAIVRTPLVHGFCFCVKRAVFAKIGLFDEENFPRGYGEENDFCFRAADAGFDLGILTSTYVFHSKSKSYGEEERTQLMREGMTALVRKVTRSRVTRAVETMRLQPGLAAARKAIAPLFDRPAATGHQRRGRLFILPSLRSDGLPAGSGYVRVLLPYRTEEICREWDVIELRSSKLPAINSADVVLVQRDGNVIPSNALEQWIATVLQSGARLIYEIDDDLFDGAALVSRGFRGDAADLSNRALTFARAAHCVTVSSDALRRKVGMINRNVSFIPNALDTDLWRLAADEPPALLHAADRGGDARVTIGYVGTPTHNQDLALVADVLASLQQRFPRRLDVQVIGGFGAGAKPFGTAIPLPLANDYPSFVRWLHANVRWDIGIVPLADNDFNAKKSYLKFLECGALGMALVCSGGPEYSRVVRHGETGLLVKNTKDAWASALATLIEQPDERHRLARAAYDDIRANHTLAALSPKLLGILLGEACARRDGTSRRG